MKCRRTSSWSWCTWARSKISTGSQHPWLQPCHHNKGMILGLVADQVPSLPRRTRPCATFFSCEVSIQLFSLCLCLRTFWFWRVVWEDGAWRGLDCERKNYWGLRTGLSSRIYTSSWLLGTENIPHTDLLLQNLTFLLQLLLASLLHLIFCMWFSWLWNWIVTTQARLQFRCNKWFSCFITTYVLFCFFKLRVIKIEFFLFCNL